MTRRPQQRLPSHQIPLCDRVTLAPDADPAWRPDANWRAWTLQPPTADVYLILRRSAQGRRRFNSKQALAQEVGVWNRTIDIILDDLDALDLIRVRRNHKGTIIGIEVNDPPPVPENLPDVLRGLVYNAPQTTEADVRRAVNYWCAKWEQTREVRYDVNRHERALVKAMLGTFGLEGLKRTMWWVLNPRNHEFDDDLIRRSDLSLTTFYARRNQIVPAFHAAEERRRAEERMKHLASLPWEERQRLERQDRDARLARASRTADD